MTDIVWEIENSVDAIVSQAFAWDYMTNVANWDDPPASFQLDGPFTAGSRGITRIPGQEPRRWFLREVNPMSSYRFEMPLDRAVISFEWRFDGLAGSETRLTQHIALHGENATAYVAQAQPVFASNLAAGMHRIALAMVNSHHNAARTTTHDFSSGDRAIRRESTS